MPLDTAVDLQPVFVSAAPAAEIMERCPSRWPGTLKRSGFARAVPWR